MGKFLDEHLAWMLKWGFGLWLSLKWLCLGWSFLVSPFGDFEGVLGFLLLLLMILAFTFIFLALPFLLYYIFFKKGVQIVSVAATQVATAVAREQANSRSVQNSSSTSVPSNTQDDGSSQT